MSAPVWHSAYRSSPPVGAGAVEPPPSRSPGLNPNNSASLWTTYKLGGGWRVGVRDNFAPMAIRMAQRGYAAATISYRLADEAPYPAAVHDARAAVRWLRGHAGTYSVDPARIALAGGSAGGQIER